MNPAGAEDRCDFLFSIIMSPSGAKFGWICLQPIIKTEGPLSLGFLDGDANLPSLPSHPLWDTGHKRLDSDMKLMLVAVLSAVQSCL